MCERFVLLTKLADTASASHKFCPFVCVHLSFAVPETSLLPLRCAPTARLLNAVMVNHFVQFRASLKQPLVVFPVSEGEGRLSDHNTIMVGGLTLVFFFLYVFYVNVK